MTLRNIDTLFLTDRIHVLGAPATVAQNCMLENLRSSALSRLTHVEDGNWQIPADADAPTCAVIFDPAWGRPATISALAEAGCRSVIWAMESPLDNAVLQAARPHTLRLLGGHTTGVANTRNRLNATSLEQQPKSGNVALITQSRSLMAAALDWALGREIGFSWLACTGDEADIDVADLLDLAALDPKTRAVVLQLGHIKQPRRFMSAARAVSHVKPVLVLQTRTGASDAPSGPDPVRSAAFARAGLVECETMGGLFDGLAALELLPRVRQDRVMVLGNGDGVCSLATDALQRESLQPVDPDPDTLSELTRVAPAARLAGAAVNLTESTTEQTVAAVATALTDAEADSVLLAHSPVVGHPHAPLVSALGEAGLDARLMTVWLGLKTAQSARTASGRARLATFATPDEAARAIRYRHKYHQNRELLTATPPPDPSVTADVAAIRERLRTLAANNNDWLVPREANALLDAYGIPTEDGEPDAIEPAVKIRIEAFAHPELAMVLKITDELMGTAPAYGFVPLDTLLSQRLLEGAISGRPALVDKTVRQLTPKLVRLSKLIVDCPELASLDLHLAMTPGGQIYSPTDPLCGITATPRPDRGRLALSPYPARMRHRVKLRGDRHYVVRAIKPSDEPRVIELLESLSPEEVRLRFFSTIRQFSHDMAARMTQIDYDREVSLVASPVDRPDQLAATATIIADPDGQAAEYAILVHHDHARIGLGRHLLDCLLRQAHARGIVTVFGEVLAENDGMLELARRLGFRIHRIPDDPSSVRAEIDVARYRSGDKSISDS